MKMKGTRTFAALLLVVTMLASLIFTGNQVMAAEPAGVKLEFVEVTSSNTFKFTGMLADASSMAKGYYKVPATIVHDSGTVTKDILIEVGNNGAISIWNSFFQYNNAAANTLPTKSLTFAKDAVFTEVKNAGSWSIVENGKTYMLSEEMKIEKGQDGTWSKVVAPTGPVGVTLEFVSVSTSNTFKFNGKLADNSNMPNGYYKVPATIVNDSGSVTKDIVLEVGNNGVINIWSSFFHWTPGNHATVPTKSLTFAKDAVITEVQIVSNVWSVKENGKTYKLSEEVSIAKGQDGSWSKVVAPTGPVGVTLEFVSVSTSNTFKFNGKLADNSNMPNGYYKVPATIVNDSGSVTKDIVLEVGNNGVINIWSSFFHWTPGNHATVPTKSLTFAKDAVITEVQIVSNVWSVKENGKTYKLSEEMSIAKGQDGTWSVGTLPIEPAGVTLEFLEVTTSNTFKFTGKLADASSMPKGYYKVPATIVHDTGSVSKDITIEVGNNGAISIWSNFFHFGPGNHATLPTKSLTIAKDAIFTEVQHVSGTGWGVVENGKTYKLSEEMSVAKGQDGTWSVGTLPVEPTGVTLEFVSVSTSNTFAFKGTLADASSLPKGYYKVPATIVHETGSVTKDITLEVGNNGAVSIWAAFFHYVPGNHATLPTKSLTIAKDAIFTEVQCVSNVWSVVENGKTYKLSEEMSIEKGQDGTWGKKTAGQVPGPGTNPNPEAINLTLEFVGVSGSNTFEFIGKLADNSYLPNGFYKVAATIVNDSGSVTKDIVIEVSSNGVIYIWSSFFQWNDAANSTVPTKSLTFAKDAIFAEAVHTGGRFQVVENGKTYKLTDKMCIINEEGWYVEGKKPVVPEIPDNIDGVNVTFSRVDSNNNFNFAWALADQTEAGKGFYSATIKVDGADRKVLIEGTGKGFWIYYHCFTLPPNGANPQIPKDTVTIPKGTVLTPVVQNKWTTVRTDGSYYKVNNEVSIKNQDGVWILANQNTENPLEVKISFKEVKRGALYLTVTTADGKDISEIYGKNWPAASGMVIRGIADENNKFTYTKVSTQYNVVSKALYLGALSLRQLDEVKIEAGTILYMGPDAESQRPIKILNSFRMTRDASDKWVADGTVTGQGGNFTQGGSSAQAGSGSPKTGDVYTTVTWVVLMSCAGLSMILLNKKRYE